MKSNLKRSLAAAAVLGCFGAQAAETVQLTNFTFSPFGGVVIPADIAANFLTTNVATGALPNPPPAKSYLGAGQMQGLLNGASFLAYCAEINNSIEIGTGLTYSDYNLVPGATAFGARAADLARLITWAGEPANASRSAAIQAAVWEIVHETTTGAYSFGSGKMSSSSQSIATQAALSDIQANWAAIALTVPVYTVWMLDGSAQDLLIYMPVPEAGTLTLMALGLAGVGFAARRRRT